MQPDSNVGDDAGVLSDMSMEPDVAPDMSPDMAVNSSPTCSLVVANELTRETHVDIVIEVADEEEAANQLSVTLNGTALNFESSWPLRGTIPVEEGPNTAELRVLDSAGAECVANAVLSAIAPTRYSNYVTSAITGYFDERAATARTGTHR